VTLTFSRSLLATSSAPAKNTDSFNTLMSEMVNMYFRITIIYNMVFVVVC
jgi:hypothetical protein